MKTKFIIIGYGWRTNFYYRITKLLPNEFEITACVLRTEERAQEITQQEGFFATSSLQLALETKPDFAVLCVPRNVTTSYLTTLMKHNIPVLCETPPAQNIEELNILWANTLALNGKIQVAEQYQFQPFYASISRLIQNGYLGEVSSAMLSAVHGYHAISLFRNYLDAAFENCTIQGQQFHFPLIETHNRAGLLTTGKPITSTRDWATIQFNSGKVAFLDFMGEQYFSEIRTRRWNIQGTRGELNDSIMRYLNPENFPITQELFRIDVGRNNIDEWSHRGYQFLDQMLYTNPYFPARLNDDEIAIATCLSRMKQYVETGTTFYPLAEALQDAYLSFVLEEALRTGTSITTSTQTWAPEQNT